ncbi:MAG TPA: autoinducer binding domain-containing protein [Alphaproteobacteria bacterium]|nr:autoinducer binding domain-containing protein [Alphaproteobacteria bacterium]
MPPFHQLEEINIFEATSLFDKLKNIGFSYVSLGLQLPQQRKVLSLFSDKNWEEVYRKNNWYDKDPIVRSAHSQFDSPIIWSATPLETKSSSCVAKNRLDVIDTTDGVSFCLQGKIYTFIVGLSSKDDRISIMEKFVLSYSEIKETCYTIEDIVRHEKK